MSEQQGKFEGWAIVEVMGHQRYAGYVTTEHFGAASMFRIDVPALPEREEELKSSRYISGVGYAEAGSKFRVEPIDGFTKLIGVSAIFAITPCTQEAAMADTMQHAARPLIPINIVRREEPKMIEADYDDAEADVESEDEDLF